MEAVGGPPGRARRGRELQRVAVAGALLATLVLLARGGAAISAQASGPGARYGHELVYDEARGETVLFGGFGGDGIPRQDTWVREGDAWRMAASTGPSPRKWPAGAFDARTGTVVLHGGREGPGRSGPSRADTWVWDGVAWSEAPGLGPPPRDHHRATYDRRRERIVLFGGWNGERHLSDTWEWDGSRWSLVATSGPAPRAAFGLAYHAGLGQVVMVGGQDLERTFADVWTWNGTVWRQLDDAAPGPRGFHAMSYDPDQELIILFAGRNGDELFRDLWAWGAAGWTRLDEDGPLLRGVFASAYDRRASRLVIHGSGHLDNGEWRLEARTWVWTRRLGWRVAGGGSRPAAAPEHGRRIE